MHKTVQYNSTIEVELWAIVAHATQNVTFKTILKTSYAMKTLQNNTSSSNIIYSKKTFSGS